MKLINYIMLIACAGLLGGCAAKVPTELANARQAYQRASAGPAAQLVPAELHKAQEALNRAEGSFKYDPKSYQTKDLAYVAERKAIMAEALASVASEKGSAAQANKEYQATQGEIMKRTEEDLARTQTEKSEAATAAAADKLAVEQQARLDAEKRATEAATAAGEGKLATEQQARLESERRAADAAAAAAADKLAVEQQARLDSDKRAADATAAATAAEKLSVEQQGRRDAEKQLADAQAALAKVAVVKEEPRGLVITLSGSVVFASNKATLLPEAQSRLSQVAETLMSTNKNRKLVVEGHTDSQGSAAFNMELSQRRAEAVRSYLISRGYPAELIEARGIGKVRPIADNASSEGRANNRRVEIIVER
jgi:outer membrane protein OmpA-like peptidoglycan-associated protein